MKKRGRPPGFKLTEEHKRKISLARMGHPVSKEVRMKLRLTWLGKKLSPEHREKIRVAGIGRRHSEETKEKMRRSNRAWERRGKPISDTIKEKMRKSHTGKKLSEYHRLRMSEVRRGPNNPMWRGGISKLIKRIRGSLKYILWRESVFKRDNWTCTDCKKRGSIVLNVDHKIPFSVLLRINKITSVDDALVCEALWSMENGVTLCVPCHKKTDTYGFKMKKYIISARLDARQNPSLA